MKQLGPATFIVIGFILLMIVALWGDVTIGQCAHALGKLIP